MVCVDARKLLNQRKLWGRDLFKNYLNFNKFFYCDIAKHGHNIRKFLKYIFTQKLSQERKLWKKIILENVIYVTLSVKYFNVS